MEYTEKGAWQGLKLHVAWLKFQCFCDAFTADYN